MDSYGRSQLQQALIRANGFVPEALPANRQGRLTANQARSIEREDRRDRRAFILVGLLVLLGACVYLAFDVRANGAVALRDDGGAYLVLAIGLVLIGLGLFWKEYQTDLERAEVAVVEGPGTKKVINTDEQPTTYEYIIGTREGVCFEVNKAAHELFVEGQSYRAYYLPRSGKLVNIDVVERDVSGAAEELPRCPVCSSTQTVSHTLDSELARKPAAGCGPLLFPFKLLIYLLRRRNPLREQADARARRAKVTMLGDLHVCKRDQVVFMRGGTMSVPVSELTRMLQQKDGGKDIARIFAQEPDSTSSDD